jgi:arabinan endo-1,5-alpha-L-arabinosidase
MNLIPVTGDIRAHDPVIVKDHGIYFRFQTSDLLTFFTSDDLVSWRKAGSVFRENPAWCDKTVPNCSNLWAPEIIRRGDEWRVYYSVSTFGSCRSAIGLAVSKTLDTDSGDYGWTDRGPVLLSEEGSGFNAIDPAVIADGNGDDWLLWGSFWGGLKMQRIGRDGMPIENAERYSVASRCTDPNPIEGGYIFFHEGWYYLFASHDFCCRGSASTYHIVVGRSRSVTGPYLDMDDVDMMQSGGTTLRDGFSFDRWAGPGHNSLFAEDGKQYLVYHAYDRLHNGAPSLMIEQFVWKDGWPSL